MKSITLSADEHLLELAQIEAQARKTTLDHLFREWLEGIADRDGKRKQALNLMRRMAEFDSGGSFSREAMNER